jgi:zinc-ribbon domain
MNCTRCGAPLETNARFCRNCGQPVPANAPGNVAPSPGQPNQPMSPQEHVSESAPTNPVESWQEPPAQPTLYPQPQTPYYQPTQPVLQPIRPATPLPGTMPSDGQGTLSGGQVMPPRALATAEKTPRRRRRGRLLGCLLTLLVLAMVIGVGWVFALRPFLHSLAQAQIDQALTTAVNQMPPAATQLPPGIVHVQENAIHNLIVLNSSPSDPVQSTQVHITPGLMRLDFQVYGLPCAVTGVPQVVGSPPNGRLVISNVTVAGIIALIMSPDEMTSLVNKHLADAQARFEHPIIQVSLKDHELDLLVGPPLSPGVPVSP